jgi:hypothetical protein
VSLYTVAELQAPVALRRLIVFLSHLEKVIEFTSTGAVDNQLR